MKFNTWDYMIFGGIAIALYFYLKDLFNLFL
jgi:hypothetical protein